jgi:hypothetical protein
MFRLLFTINRSAIAGLDNSQFTVAQALGFSVSTSRIVAADLNTETITPNHYEVFLSFTVQSPRNAYPVLQFYLQSPWFFTLYSVHLYSTAASDFLCLL